MIEGYTLKTDRNKQWAKIEVRMIEDGNSRKNIKSCKDYFFDGKDEGATFRWHDRLMFYPAPTIAGWQKLFDEEISEPLSDQDYFTFQLFFCAQFYDYFFGIEDQSYYFKTAFGERYDINKVFPIRINKEDEHRVITLTPNQILRHLMTCFNRYMEDIKVDYAGLLRFNLEYLDSLLHLVSSKFFGIERNTGSTEDGVRIAAVQSSIQKMLKWSYAKPSKKIDKERIDAANAVKDVFLKHAGQLGEFNALHDKVRKELKIKD
jgi:hypothetical protein